MRSSDLVLLVLVAFCPATTSAGATCPEAKLRKDPDPVAFADVDGLHRTFLTYGGCDPRKYVELAESLSDRIPKVLVERWSELEQLDARCSANPRFRKFVLWFINAAGDPDALSRLANLSGSCEGETKALCEDIHRRALEALAESAAALDGGTR